MSYFQQNSWHSRFNGLLVYCNHFELCHSILFGNLLFIINNVRPLFVLWQRFSNYGLRTTYGPRGLPLWSFKKDRRKNKIQMNCVSHYTLAENLSIWKWHMTIAFHFSPSTDILWNLLPYPFTDCPLYSQQQIRDLKHYESGVSCHIFPAQLAPRL